MINEFDYPRCETCKHWRGKPGVEWGYCNESGAAAKAWSITDWGHEEISTSPDFGCIQHEPKD